MKPILFLAAFLVLGAPANPFQEPEVRESVEIAPGRRATKRNRPPRLTTTLPESVLNADVIHFRVTAQDFDGDLVSLQLLNPPPGLIFLPVVNAPSPVVRDVVWRVQDGDGARQELVFETRDDADPTRRVRQRFSVRIDRVSQRRSMLQIGDVTGDGVLDVVCGSSQAGADDTGGIWVWAGTTTPSGVPTACLTVPSADPDDRLGEGAGRPILLADVTGEGVLDVVAAAPLAGSNDAGAIYLWKGGATLVGARSPSATFSVPDATGARLALGSGRNQSLLITDVTGDGVNDVIGVAYSQDVGGVLAAGAVHVWSGGPTVSGSPSPTATLTVSGSGNGDSLGLLFTQGTLLEDLTGDGVDDLLVARTTAEVAGVESVGALYLWAGGSALAGTPAPAATLTVAGAAPNDSLGNMGNTQSIRLADLTGDGSLDVLAGASFADVAGTIDAGAFYLWAGDDGFAGSMTQTARLAEPLLSVALGRADIDRGSGMLLADVTGDGLLDVIGMSSLADLGATDAGLLYIWEGGAGMTGDRTPSATLRVPGASAGSQLGAGEEALRAADVTGDGCLDIVAVSRTAEAGGVPGAGAVYVWEGGASLAGVVTPHATLTVSGASADDHMGDLSGRALVLADVSGDGVLDVITGSSRADVGGVVDAGALHVWRGGSNLTGSVPAEATLTIPGATSGDALGFYVGTEGVQVADLTGDGILDILSGSYLVDHGAGHNTGALYLWQGGTLLFAALNPRATLRFGTNTTDDLLGYLGQFTQAIRIAEVTGDGFLDVVVGGSYVDGLGVLDAGGFFVYRGGPSMNGTIGPLTQLYSSVRTTGDLLGSGGSDTFQLADVTGDGRLDVIVASPFFDAGGVGDTGAVHVWRGPTVSILNSLFQTSLLTVPGALPNDRLGH